MNRRCSILFTLATLAANFAQAAPAVELTAAQIVERNVAARGGLTAWRAVNSLTMAGEMDAGGKQDARLPFVMSMKRGQKSRLELTFQGQVAVQVWDGRQGWKLRPFLNRNEVEPFTAAETRSAAAAAELDGPLIDFARKGSQVELAGTELVEGLSAYKLKLTLKGGEQVNLWIDAASFLEVKIDGEPRKLDGRMHPVAILYRDYRKVGALTVPHLLETVVEGVKPSHKMSIQSVKLNLVLDDALFVRPALALAQAPAPAQ
jgi:hypothetical protein